MRTSCLIQRQSIKFLQDTERGANGWPSDRGHMVCVPNNLSI